MAGIILPNRFTRQPQGPAELDSSEVCKGIVDVWTGANPYYIASPKNLSLLTPTATPILTSGAWAKGLQFDGSSQYLLRSASSMTQTAEGSLLVVALPLNTSATTRSIFGYGNTASANQLFFIGQGASAGQLSFFARSDANTSQNLQVAGGAGWADGKPAVVIGTRSESKNIHRLYVNALSLSPTTATALGTSTFNRTTVGALTRNSTSLFFNGGVFLAIAWNRSLTEGEVTALSTNPWMVFKPSARKLYVEGGGVSPDVTVAITGQSITASTGTLAPSSSVATSGQSVIASQGSVSTDTSVSGNGLQIAATQGSVVASHDTALAGISVSVNQGFVSPETLVQGFGQEITAQQGNVFVVGDVTVAIIGQEIVCAQGDVAATTGNDAQSGISRLDAIAHYEKLIKAKHAKREAEEKAEIERRQALKRLDQEPSDSEQFNDLLDDVDEETAEAAMPSPVARNVEADNSPLAYQEISQLVVNITSQLPIAMPYMPSPQAMFLRRQIQQAQEQQEIEEQAALLRAKKQRDIEAILLLMA